MGKNTARAVKRAANKAEKIHEEIYGKPNDGTVDPDAILDTLNGEPVVDPADPTPAKPAEPPAEPAEPPLSLVPDPADPADPAEPVDPPESPAEPITPPAEPDATELLAKAEHKYSVLQGMHRKLLEENTDFRQRLDALESAPIAPIEPSPVATGGLTDDDIEGYGTDLVDMVKRAAHEEFSPELAKLREENKQLKQQITGVTATVDTQAKGSVYGTLAKEVPTWEQINESEEFLFWLAQRDPFSNERRHDLLTNAFKTNDSARVVNFFNAFLNENTAVAPPEPAAAPAAPVTPKIDLVSMAAPGKAQAPGQPSNQTDTRRYTREEISAHYKSVQTGKFNGTAADKKRIENAFIEAANDGRVD